MRPCSGRGLFLDPEMFVQGGGGPMGDLELDPVVAIREKGKIVGAGRLLQIWQEQEDVSLKLLIRKTIVR